MVRVFKCHSFASQHVIPINKEPMTICTDDDKVFVATNDCEIIVYRVHDGTSTEIQRLPTISQVDTIAFNSFKNYIATVELKKSWKRLTKSVRVYLNWDVDTPAGAKPRTKVRVAGKSHVQHVSGSSNVGVMEIVELPVDGNATCVAVCRYTGNFAVACGSEVKLCSVVEKTIANSEKTYLDIEIFLELCWNFPVESISLCEEYVVCCSHKEVQGIRIRYDEGEKISPRVLKKLTSSPSQSVGSGGHGASLFSQVYQEQSWPSSANASPQSYISETILYTDHHRAERSVTFSPQSDLDISEFRRSARSGSDAQATAKDFSSVGMRPGPRQSPKLTTSVGYINNSSSHIVDDENFVEWNFQHGGGVAGGDAVCLPGLHTSSTQSQCHHHAHIISPPVLSDFSGGKVKSSSGVQAETVLHLSDLREQEDWMKVILIPTYSGVPTAPLRVPNLSTDRMRSSSTLNRTSMCCYISGNRGGYLYQLSPLLTQISAYKYTDKASQVGVGQSHLHVVTNTGIETYTSRWGAVSLEMSHQEDDELNFTKTFPPSSLDICLCGLEPFLGAVNLAVGANFLAILSKIEDPAGKEDADWSLYILHSFRLVDIYKDMITFAQNIQVTGPASYIHLLQEAHLLLCTHPLYTMVRDVEVKKCLSEVCRMLGDYYAQPGQDDWSLCSPYYRSSGATVEDIVRDALLEAVKTSPCQFGLGLLDYLDNVLFSEDEYINLTTNTCNSVMDIYAVACPEKLSDLILFSNVKEFSAEIAFKHLKTWLALKSNAGQVISAVDKLAMTQLQLTRCEVELARLELESINKSDLVDVCSSHPMLIHDNLNTFTPLAQLMRQHMSSTLMEVLVEMLDRCSMSLDSLIILLKNQSSSDVPYNNHIREVLELVLSDEKRKFLFSEAALMLCESYIARIRDRSPSPAKQMSSTAPQKFTLPQGNGHFAPRYAWLDYLPPFHNPSKMLRPCQRLEVKQVPGQVSRSSALPLAKVSKQGNREKCPCCTCNENLLKLQSLLCSPCLSDELVTFVLEQLGDSKGQGQTSATDSDDSDTLEGQGDQKIMEAKGAAAASGDDLGIDDECWDSIWLLCQTKLDLGKAMSQMVEKYPYIAGSFSACCFNGNDDMYASLLRQMEAAMKACDENSPATWEETLVKAYKDLLSRMSELFPPGKFLELLPGDGNLYFMLPYLTASINQEHTHKLKQKIVTMGKELMS